MNYQHLFTSFQKKKKKKKKKKKERKERKKEEKTGFNYHVLLFFASMLSVKLSIHLP